MAEFDLISDIHLDFWVRMNWNWWQENKQIHEFARQLLPESVSGILVIAGDLGHYNKQNYQLLKALREYYRHILLVPGNHDYYLVNKSASYRHAYNSLNRWIEMKILASKLPSVVCLDGDTVQIGGIMFGGCGMWYDFQYGIQILNAHYNRNVEYWTANSNDAVMLKGLPRLTRQMFDEEKKKLARIMKQSDVIVTHFSPDWSHVPDRRRLDLSVGFYYFDGTPYFPHIADKIWCFGHIHERMDYKLHHCRFINAALGYPKENAMKPRRAVRVSNGSP